MPGIWEKIKAMPRDMGKAVGMRQAGEAMANWLVDQGITAEELEEKMLAGEPVLIRALSAIPENELSRARQAAASLAPHITEEDCPKILQALAGHPACREHAAMLYERYFYSHFVPAVRDAMSWLMQPPSTTGTPE